MNSVQSPIRGRLVTSIAVLSIVGVLASMSWRLAPSIHASELTKSAPPKNAADGSSTGKASARQITAEGLRETVGSRYHAKILAPDALRTDAPRNMTAQAIQKVFEELRLRHFMDAKGNVVFPGGTSIDKTTQESGQKHGDFVRGVKTFDDPKGNRITIRQYSEPGIGTLLVWEYSKGDVQQISVILQQELARQGVKLK